jgi:hypothetical protein
MSWPGSQKEGSLPPAGPHDITSPQMAAPEKLLYFIATELSLATYRENNYPLNMPDAQPLLADGLLASRHPDLCPSRHSFVDWR